MKVHQHASVTNDKRKWAESENNQLSREREREKTIGTHGEHRRQRSKGK
jgi:hypothetical protein